MDLNSFEFIGGGANGKVYRCKDNLGRDLAAKFFVDDFDPISRMVEQHANTLAKIDHPNVVRIMGAIRVQHPEKPQNEKPELALIMEYIPSVSFATWLTSLTGGRDALKRFGLGLLDGLAAFHDRGLAHSDLHAGNVRVAAGIPKLIDPLAHDPASVLTTALNTDRQQHDIRDAHRLLHQALAAHKAPHSTLRLFLSDIDTIHTTTQLRSRFELCIADLSDNNKQHPNDDDYYQKFRLMQRSNDVVGYEESRKLTLRHLTSVMELLREDADKTITSHEAAETACDECLDRLHSFFALIMSAAETSISPYCNDVDEIDRIATAEWPRSGNTQYVELPNTLTFALVYTAGSAAISRRNSQIITRLLTLRLPDQYTRRSVQVYQLRNVVGWPSTFFNHAQASWDWLLRRYAKDGVLQQVFPTESDYRVCLATMNLLLYIVSLKIQTKNGDVELGNSDGYRYAIPPHWTNLRETELVRVWRLCRTEEIWQVLASLARDHIGDVRRHWAHIVDWSTEFWIKSRGELAFVPDWVRNEPPMP